MTRWGVSLACVALLVAASALTGTFSARAGEDDEAKLPPPADKKVDFARDIQPILAKHCVKCHGAEKQESGLRLDQKAAALAGGDAGASIIPGDSADSLLIEYVAGIDPDVVMPPEGDLLSKQDVGLLRAWIDQGVIWSETGQADATKSSHWAYQPIQRPEVPQSAASDWVRNPIDSFVLARLQTAHVEPSPPASPTTLIRRLYLDLLGLPPSPREVDEFHNDQSPHAYEDLVERVLQSPHFGERWGRHWLDKARYADSDGYEKDNPRPDAWRWRDWVIDAVNRDLPFDQFTVEQLAGDLLPNATDMQKLATAFNRQTLTNTEGGADQEQFRVEAVFDRVETLGAVWLGLTVGCSRCHSHKYDAIPQREYYQLFAHFNNGDEVTANIPTSEADTARFQVARAEHDQAVRNLQEQIAKARENLAAAAVAEWEAKVQAELQAVPQTPVAFHELRSVEVRGPDGVKFQPQPDGSFLVTGKDVGKGVYTLTAQTNVRSISGFRLEALSDKSLPESGPGRAKNGNFVLTEFAAALAPLKEFTADQRVTLRNARADFSQNEFAADRAIDENEETGWAVAPQMGRDHHIEFSLPEPVSNDGSMWLQLVLSQQYQTPHMLGRFRVTAMTGRTADDIAPEPIRQILAVTPDQRTTEQQRSLADYYAAVDPQIGRLTRQLALLEKNAPKPPLMGVRVIAQRTSSPRTTFILRRGDFLQPLRDTAIEPAGLSVLHTFESPNATTAGDRLALARWVAAPNNPLTPRVAVNQVWSHLFGHGLVRTVNDFGVRGERSSHPELLDWLAHILTTDLNWNRKGLIRLIVNSSTYRQASRHRPELLDVDPQNNLLSRQNRFRVEAEIVRDLALASSGLLARKVGGPSVFPPMPADVAEISYANNFKWNASQGEDRYRRGMYTFFKRTAPYPNLMNFDCPDSNTTCVERRTSNTALQALTTLNDSVFVEASQALAQRLLAEGLDNDSQRLTLAFRLCLSRTPTSVELGRFADLLAASREWYNHNGEYAQKLIGSAQVAGVSPSELAAWVATSRIMLNLDEFFTRE